MRLNVQQNVRQTWPTDSLRGCFHCLLTSGVPFATFALVFLRLWGPKKALQTAAKKRRKSETGEIWQRQRRKAKLRLSEAQFTGHSSFVLICIVALG